MENFSQSRSFIVGIAVETSIEAALIYNDLVYASNFAGDDGWFARSNDFMLKRLPFMTENPLRKHLNLLIEAGWIEKKIKKLDGNPTCHYRIARFLTAESAVTKENAESAETIKGIVVNKTNSSADAPHAESRTAKETQIPPVIFGGEAKEKYSGVVNPTTELLVKLIVIINPREKPTTERKRMLNARLKDYKRDEIVAAARALSKSTWHKENHQMSIDNLLAPSKFGRWYSQVTANGDTPPLTDAEITAQFEAEKRELDAHNAEMMKVFESSEEGENGTKQTDSPS